MNKVFGGFEDTIEQGASGASSAVKKQAASFVKTAAGQISGNPVSQNPNTQTSQSPNGTNEQAASGQNQQMSDDQARQFLKDLYGPSKPQIQDKNNQQQSAVLPPAQSQSILQQAIGVSPSDPNAGKSPQEIAEIQSLRNQLHADYYQSLTKPKQQEERASEKLEREEQEKQMEDLEEEKKKPKDLPVTVKQGTGETVVGVSG